jgi:hypothetical protein
LTAFLLSNSLGLKKQFRWPLSTADFAANSVIIQNGASGTEFYYYDEMSSYPTGEDGRPGQWHLTANGLNVPAEGDTTVDPAGTVKFAFDNAPRTLIAGAIMDDQGMISEFEVEPHDQFENPTISTTASVFVNLSSVRSPSPTNDNYNFFASSISLVPTTTLEVSTNSWFAKVYYRDSRASATYNPKGSGPVIVAKETPDQGWTAGSQVVNVIADAITKLAFTNTNLVLTAGTTSQAFTVQTQDKFSNPSQIKVNQCDDAPRTSVLVGVRSNSGGLKKFNSVGYGWQNDTGTVKIGVNTDSTSFFLIDTVLGTYNLTADEDYYTPRGWTAAASTYSVVANDPYKLVFATPARRLIAGTTVQYYPDFTTGAPTNTVITIQVQDFWGNRVAVSSVTTVSIKTLAPPTAPNAMATKDDPNDLTKYVRIDPTDTPLSITLTPGMTDASLYFKAALVGQVPLQAMILGLEPAVQNQTITPAPATHFTIEHPYSKSNPLSVQIPGPVTVQARDQYENKACGDAVNGNYYGGTVVFWHNGSTDTVTLNPSTFTFTQAATSDQPVPGRFINLQITDWIQETLRVGCTDIAKPSINGRTINSAIDPANGSSNDIVTVGVVATPKDFAPESVSWKQELGIATSLTQGDGMVASRPSPVAMMMLTLGVNPVDPLVNSTATWTSITIDRTGDLSNLHVAEIDVYKDLGNSGTFEGDSDITRKYTSAYDEFVSSGTFSGSSTRLAITLNTAQTVTKIRQNYFICVRISPDAQQNTTLGLTLPQGALALSGAALLAKNNLPFDTYNSPIVAEPAQIFVDYNYSDTNSNIAAWYDPDGSSGSQTAQKNMTVTQGQAAAGFMRLGLWTPEYQGIWDKLIITRAGDSADSDIVSCRIYEDSNLTGRFEFGSDESISPETVFVNGSATIDLDNQLIGQTTQYYFLVYKLADSAQVGKTVGVLIDPSGFIRAEGEMAASNPAKSAAHAAQAALFPLSSNLTPIEATKDTLIVDEAASGGVVPGAVTQGDKDVPLVRLRLRTDARSVIWSGLRIDRRNVAGLNADSDVANIKVYFDRGVARLAQNIAADTTGVIRLTTTNNFGASGVLYIGSEIMKYSAVLSSNTVNIPPTGRASGNTAAVTHAFGDDVVSTGNNELNPDTDQLVSPALPTTVTFSSGTANIPILGPKNGQEITQGYKNEGKIYFIAYDIDYYANLGEIRLGLTTKTTAYVTVNVPKQVSTDLFPFYSEINRVMEYADEVTFSPENATTIDSLMQAATNQAVLTFKAKTNRSEALFNSVKITRTGTAEDSDITAVRIWYDGNNNGLLDQGTTQDWIIGSGLFNNMGNPGEAVISITSSPVTLVGIPADPSIWCKITARAGMEKRYFVTYDIFDSALPEKTMGASLTSANSFTVSSPNFVSSTTLPFVSDLRTIVPSRRNVTVTAESLHTTTLSQALGAQDSTIMVNSVAGFPDEGGLVLDSEIILYTGRNTTNNMFTGVTRGAWNSAAVTHSSGTIVSGSYLQGTVNAPVEKMTVSCDGFQVRWYTLQITRDAPAGLSGNDTDIKLIKIWKDNGNGVLDRDPTTGLIAAEQLVSSGTAVFGNVTGGVCNIKLFGDGVDASRGESYILINTTPTVYWVTMDVDQTATKGAVIGMRCSQASDMQIGARQRNDGVHLVVDGSGQDYPGDPFPFRSGYMFVYATLDTMTVNYQPFIWASITQNAEDQPMMELKLKATQNTAIWQGIKVDLTGNCIDNDVTLVKVWQDLNGNDMFDSADKATSGGEYVGLLTYGTENFANKTVTLTFKTPQIITSTGTLNYFITYNINSLATVGHTVGLSIGSTAYFTVDSPDLVTLSQAPPFVTTTPPIIEYPDIVSFEPWPWFNPETEKDVLSNVILTQGDKNVPVLRFRLKSNISEAIWSKIRLERIGTGAPGQPINGSNSDVQYVKIFIDSNNNESLDAGDTLITSGTDQFPLDAVGPTADVSLTVPQTLRPSWQYYFITYDIALTAHANNSLGIRIKDRSWITVSQPNSVEPFPNTAPFNELSYFDSSLAQIQPLTVSFHTDNIAPLVKLPGDADVPILRLKFAPSAHSVTISSITLNQTGTIETSPTSPSYYYGRGDGDFSRIRLWLDNGDGQLNTAQDTVLCSLPSRRWLLDNGLNPEAIANFSGGVVTLQCGVTAGTEGRTLFVTADIGNSDAGGKSTFGHTAGFQLLKYGSLIIVPETAVSATANSFPYASGKLQIADASIVSVSVRPDKSEATDEGWVNSNTSLSAKWNVVKVSQANITGFKAAVGSLPTSVDATLGMGSSGWTTTTNQSIEIKGLALSEPVVVFLAEDLTISQSDGSISVEYPDGHPKKGIANPTDYFDKSGYIMINKEIISYTDKTANTFTGITRGLSGTEIAVHYKGNQVTNKAYFFKVKAQTDLAGETPEKWGVVRIDLTAPSAPASIVPTPVKTGVPAEDGKYEVTWEHSKDFESGVEVYEVQERTDADPVWKMIDVVAGDRFSTNVGDGSASDIDGNALTDAPREKGHFYYYRVRAKNNAGSWGEWSTPSSAATTSIPGEVISSVSNYPNPVDTRKGGEEAKTSIVYVLNQDAEVGITIYDLLGYEVMAWNFSAGSEGGRKGANRILWDGSNGMGDKVGKGGYIAQIRVKSDKGLVTAIRKIGVIH